MVPQNSPAQSDIKKHYLLYKSATIYMMSVLYHASLLFFLKAMYF